MSQRAPLDNLSPALCCMSRSVAIQAHCSWPAPWLKLRVCGWWQIWMVGKPVLLEVFVNEGFLQCLLSGGIFCCQMHTMQVRIGGVHHVQTPAKNRCMVSFHCRGFQHWCSPAAIMIWVSPRNFIWGHIWYIAQAMAVSHLILHSPLLHLAWDNGHA